MMKFPNTVLAAARVACLFGAIAAAFAAPSIAGPASGTGEPEARQASVTQGPQEMSLPELERRLRDTRAMNVFQKLALQREVDDLLTRFRHAHTAGKSEVAGLRRPYEGLIANIKSLLGRDDPTLANEISASREAIWEVLANRSKFASL